MILRIASGLGGSGIAGRQQLRHWALFSPGINVADQPAHSIGAELPGLWNAALSDKALKRLYGQAQELCRDFFGDDAGGDCNCGDGHGHVLGLGVPCRAWLEELEERSGAGSQVKCGGSPAAL